MGTGVMNRRGFLRNLGTGLLVTAAPAIVDSKGNFATAVDHTLDDLNPSVHAITNLLQEQRCAADVIIEQIKHFKELVESQAAAKEARYATLYEGIYAQCQKTRYEEDIRAAVERANNRVGRYPEVDSWQRDSAGTIYYVDHVQYPVEKELVKKQADWERVGELWRESCPPRTL